MQLAAFRRLKLRSAGQRRPCNARKRTVPKASCHLPQQLVSRPTLLVIQRSPLDLYLPTAYLELRSPLAHWGPTAGIDLTGCVMLADA